jgi:hypothetical protein
MRGFVILSGMLLVTAAPAYAGDPIKPDKVLCRSTRVLGSNLTERVCKTKAQWDEEKKRSREYLEAARPIPAPIPPR